MSKKTVSFVLAMLMVLALAVPTYADGPALSGKGIYPIVPNPGDLTIKVMVVAHPAIIDWQTNAMSKWMEEQTNIHVEYQTIPFEGRAEAFQLALAGDEYPDAFMLPFSNTMNANVLNRYGVNEKRLAPLNDLIKGNMPNLQKAFDDNPGYEGMMKMLDGNIYCLPEINQCFHCTLATKLWINTEFLKAVGKQMPTTIDEFYDVLVAFRDGDPNGNGIADEVPLAGARLDGWNNMVEYFLMNSFGYYDCRLQANMVDRLPIGFYLEGDEVKVPFAEPGFKEGLQFMHKLYSEGLLYDGSFTNNYESLVNLVESPDAEKVGVVAGGYGGMFCDLAGERYPHYAALMPLKGPSGLQQIPQNTYDIGLAGIAISADSPNKEAVAKWADLLYSFEGTTNSYYGPQDVCWRLPKEGEMGINGKPALYTQLTPWQEIEPQNDHWVQSGITYRSSDWRLGMTYDQSTPLYSGDGLEALLYNVSKGMLAYAVPEKYMPPVKFTTEDADAMSVSTVEVGNLIKEYVAGFITGNYSLDTDFDGFLAKLSDAGLPGLVEKYQKAYDDQFKK